MSQRNLCLRVSTPGGSDVAPAPLRGGVTDWGYEEVRGCADVPVGRLGVWWQFRYFGTSHYRSDNDRYPHNDGPTDDDRCPYNHGRTDDDRCPYNHGRTDDDRCPYNHGRTDDDRCPYNDGRTDDDHCPHNDGPTDHYRSPASTHSHTA